MKIRDRRELERYVRHLANEMGLRDWTITLCIGEPSDAIDRYDAEYISAVMECVPGRKLGVMTLPPECREQPLDELRNTVCHELIHCHLSPLWATGTRLMQLLGPTAQEAVEQSYEMDLELAVDAIATDWGRKLPTIDWPA